MSPNVPRVADVPRKGYRINCDKKVFPRAACGNAENDSLIKVNMLILKNPNDDSKIIGRALLWNINMLDGENVERIYMDRIYYIKGGKRL